MSETDTKLVVVLGMHRSGTSAITRGLSALGVHLGERLEPPAVGLNDKGYWEDIDVVALNDEMLNVIGNDWHSLVPIQQADIELLKSMDYVSRASKLVKKKLVEMPVLGFKDPRTAKMLPFWRLVFAQLNISPAYVIAVRHPLSVVRSLQKRDKFDVEKSYCLWLEHVVPALIDTIGADKVVVDFDLMMADPKSQLKRVAHVLKLPFDENSHEVKEYIGEFLDVKLLHTQFKLEDLHRDPCAPIDVIKAYELLIRLARDEININMPEVETEFREVNKRLHALSPVLSYLTRLEKRGKEHNELVVALNRNLDEHAEQVDALTQALVERDNQINGLNQTLSEYDRQLARASATIAEIQASTSWQVTAPLRYLSSNIRNTVNFLRRVYYMLQRSGGILSATRKTVRVFYKEGFAGIRSRIGKDRGHVPLHETASQAPASVEARLSIVPYYLNPSLSENALDPSVKTSIAVHMHLFHVEMLDELLSYLANIPATYDLYVSVPESIEKEHLSTLLKAKLSLAGKIIIESVPNRGRDIAPLIIQFGSRLTQYDIIAHIHTKKSPHDAQLGAWCKYILDRLFAPPGSGGGCVRHILELLQTTAKIVYPEGQSQIIKGRTGWADNYGLARRVLEAHTKLSIDDFPTIEFPEGAMFWARTDCLKDFLSLPLRYVDFPSEPIPTDGTLAHALERLILVFASQYDGQCIRVHRNDSIFDYRYYEEQHDYSQSITHQDIKVLSYYLPQFHPIPENDAWHGKGFTEWTKVRAANPLFEGHYQQHIPHSDIGFYLLDSPKTLRQQADMMQKAGVHGQVFYHYWFSGKLILEQPAKMLLDNPDIKMPFCFCWANENWTRRWDGNENEILLGQEYSGNDARAFIQYLIPFFRDRRYITVDGRPVLFVYRPSSIPNPQEYLRIWGDECADAGIKPPYVVAVLTRGATDPEDFGMDAGVERVLHDWTAGAVQETKYTLRPYCKAINGSVLSYEEVAKFYGEQTEKKSFTYFRSLVPTWDNTARYGSDALLLHGSTPLMFQNWLQKTIAYTRSTLPEDRRFVLVNAWNEWAEGAHLEPDSRFGYSYLNGVGRALSDIGYADALYSNRPLSTGIRLHLHVPEIVQAQLRADPYLKKRFLFCLSRSSIFSICSEISIDAPDLVDDLPKAALATSEHIVSADFTLQFRRIALFDSLVIEKMIQTAYGCQGSIVLSNAYDSDAKPVSITENGSVDAHVVHKAPLVLLPISGVENGCKNVRMRTDAHSFVAYPNSMPPEKLPAVTTIIRFHKSGDITVLKNALLCLAAMQDCVVIPLIAAQDLYEEQMIELTSLLDTIPWASGFEPVVHHYKSPGAAGDLRSKMLNESLWKVTTRYAAFLDYDDLLMPHAYSWLISRMKMTGKAIAFGRVYSTIYDGSTGTFLERRREYEYGYSYEEFVRHNHAPIHSFMLDLENVDFSRVRYFEDQRYMEDYLLTLQLFKRNNADWNGLKQNVYIGDYIHSVHREHTLAFVSQTDRDQLLRTPEYQLCEQRINDVRAMIS